MTYQNRICDYNINIYLFITIYPFLNYINYNDSSKNDFIISSNEYIKAIYPRNLNVLKNFGGYRDSINDIKLYNNVNEMSSTLMRPVNFTKKQAFH